MGSLMLPLKNHSSIQMKMNRPKSIVWTMSCRRWRIRLLLSHHSRSISGINRLVLRKRLIVTRRKLRYMLRICQFLILKSRKKRSTFIQRACPTMQQAMCQVNKSCLYISINKYRSWAQSPRAEILSKAAIQIPNLNMCLLQDPKLRKIRGTPLSIRQLDRLMMMVLYVKVIQVDSARAIYNFKRAILNSTILKALGTPLNIIKRITHNLVKHGKRICSRQLK